ncbi:hypothetical protein [uncultured Sphingomonas sp.]|uniref:hypothetical protein n=1 Tax=uncultured Sphingomonas sp. TaxID=158754 RepID=UPI0025EF84FA|nr:hypothetical protein [uncultured Sphingomonas sp.]
MASDGPHPILASVPVGGTAAVTVVERAIEVAGSGRCHSVNHIRQTLIREDYADVGNALKGHAVNQQLIALIRSSRPSPP